MVRPKTWADMKEDIFIVLNPQDDQFKENTKDVMHDLRDIWR